MSMSVQTTTVEPSTFSYYSVQMPFVLISDVDEVQTSYVDVSQTPYVDGVLTSNVQYVIREGRMVRKQPPTAARPLEGTSSQEEVKREDDEILRQLESTQARISIWSLLTSSSTHRDALIRVVSQIRVETTTTPERLIHMVMVGRATCIVFSDDDLPPKGSDHTRPLYISVGCLGRRVPFVLLENGSTLNVCHLATAIALGYTPFDFDPSKQTIQAYDNTQREIMDTLEIELLIGPATFVTIAGAIHSSIHQKVKFIHDGRSICPDFVALSFDQHGSTVVLDMMKSVSYLPKDGIRAPDRPDEFMPIPYHDIPFGLGFIPIEADYSYMARLHKERVRARLTHTPFDYSVRSYTISLTDYFVRASEPRTCSDDRMSLMTLYFLDEIDEHGTFAKVEDIMDRTIPHDELVDEMFTMSLSQIDEIVQPWLASPFDLFRVFVIETAEEIPTAPAPEFVEDILDVDVLFDGPVGLVEGASDFVDPPLSFDVLSRFVSIVDFGTMHQPRELRIGLDLSIDEKDGLARFLISYLDDDKVRVCVDFRDLNKASPKDDFPLPHINMLVDSTTIHSMLSFMDGFFGYNPILMTPKDMEKTSFITDWGTYCYRRATTTLFHDMMHVDVEVYVDDMIVKSWDRLDHLAALERLNPKKCTFGVTSRKLLGYMVSERGIEVDPDKIIVILDMPAPRTERESQPTIWDDQCQRTFERIRDYLLSPPFLVPPTPGHPLLLYLSVLDVALGYMLAHLMIRKGASHLLFE
ncbi:hypothetical protein AAG906_018654 [Vitis piasezkii]